MVYTHIGGLKRGIIQRMEKNAILQSILCTQTAYKTQIKNLYVKKRRTNLQILEYNSNFVTGARIAVLLCTETTQKIYRGGAEVDFFSRSRYYNKTAILAPVTKVTFFQERWIITNFILWK